MMATDPRQALLDFLDDGVFLPAINVDPANCATAGDRRLLESLKKRVTTTLLKYLEQYQTAALVRSNFFQDLDPPLGTT